VNPNFNVKLGIPAGDASGPGLHFLNNCIKRVSARMMWKGNKPSAKTMYSDTAQQGFRVFFGTDVLGSGDTNTMRILMENLLAFERRVDPLAKSQEGRHSTLTVNFLGEEATFPICEFGIISINADQKSAYVEFEVRVVIG
jgi:hypothetical protein